MLSMALTTTRTQLFTLKDVGVSCQGDRLRRLVLLERATTPRRGPSSSQRGAKSAGGRSRREGPEGGARQPLRNQVRSVS